MVEIVSFLARLLVQDVGEILCYAGWHKWRPSGQFTRKCQRRLCGRREWMP